MVLERGERNGESSPPFYGKNPTTRMVVKSECDTVVRVSGRRRRGSGEREILCREHRTRKRERWSEIRWSERVSVRDGVG